VAVLPDRRPVAGSVGPQPAGRRGRGHRVLHGSSPFRFAAREGAVLAYTELFLAKDPRYYLVISVAALAISAIAALVAVRRAVRVVPVEVLRGTA